MPSPFPGMDPFLEGDSWLGVHSQLAAEIARQLSPRVLPKYTAHTTERLVYETHDDVAVTTAVSSVYPDVSVRSRDSVDGSSPIGAAAIAPVRLTTIVPVAVPHVSIEIRDVQGRMLVTSIEILSPSNKRGAGREEYLIKRRRVLLSSAHLLEIDLLRGGARVPMQEPLPPASYYVVLSRAELRPAVDVWPVTLAEPLPVVPVPLLPGDADVELDLQAALNGIYDLLGYRYSTDYSRLPPPVLPAGDMAFVEERLAAAGLP